MSPASEVREILLPLLPEVVTTNIVTALEPLESSLVTKVIRSIDESTIRNHLIDVYIMGPTRSYDVPVAKFLSRDILIEMGISRRTQVTHVPITRFSEHERVFEYFHRFKRNIPVIHTDLPFQVTPNIPFHKHHLEDIAEDVVNMIKMMML